MKIYVGADHRGYSLKKKVIKILNASGQDVVDMGTDSGVVSCDYPKIASKVAVQVAKSRHSYGILVCMSGIGQTIAANKVRGVYAALCYNAGAALLARRHNNANILVLGAKFVKKGDLKKIIKVWLKAQFDGGRHRRRFNQIKKIEKGMKL